MDTSQMLKGILEGCLLKIISKGETYGRNDRKIGPLRFYDGKGRKHLSAIVEDAEGGFGAVTKTSRIRRSTKKILSNHEKGLEALEQFKVNWLAIFDGVNKLLKWTEKGRMEMGLTDKSKEFIENLRAYLISSGKSEKEIEDIVGELEDHLMEAEKRGKSVEHVIGSSPKKYMEQLAKEMTFDYKEWTKYGVIIIFVVLAYKMMGDVIRSDMAYSCIELIGYPLAGLVNIFAMMKTFRFLAGHLLTKGKKIAILTAFGMFQIGTFLMLIWLNDVYGNEWLRFGGTGTLFIFCLSLLIFIGSAFWSKSWAFIIVPAMLFLPEYVLGFSSIDPLYQIGIAYGISVIGIIIYFSFLSWKDKKKADKESD